MVLYLNKLDCADCAAKIERKIAATEGFSSVRLTFATKKLSFESSLPDPIEAVRRIIAAIEDGVTVSALPSEEGEENAKRRKIIFFVTMGISALLLIAGVLLDDIKAAHIALIVTAYAVAGWDVVFHAVKNIFKGKLFDEMFLMTAATLGAIAIGEYPEAVFVMIFYKTGEFFQDYAVSKSRNSIKSLVKLQGESVTVEGQDGEAVVKAPDEVRVGEIMILKAGERLCLDGAVVSGSADMDTAALTGESQPRAVSAGSEVLAGFVNTNGNIKVRASRAAADSAVSRILEMVQNSADKKARSEKFVTKFSQVYTPAVVGLTLLAVLLLPLAFHVAWKDAINRALVFLVVSCPCALVISIPLGFFGGIGGASRKGILFKGNCHIESAARIEKVAFDKTGTLTTGRFSVEEIRAAGMSEYGLLAIAAALESGSNHPLAMSITAHAKAAGVDYAGVKLSGYEEKAGLGVRALADGQDALCGNMRLLAAYGIRAEHTPSGTAVFLAVGGKYAGYILCGDELKPESVAAVAELKEMGIVPAVLTGDHAPAACAAADKLGIAEYYAELLPENKVDVLEKMLSAKSKGGTVAFVGDGINDSPVITRADVGFAMGGMGSDAAIEAADCVIINDSPLKVAEAIRCAKRTRRIIIQNIAFSLAVKFAVLGLAAFNVVGLWVGILADVGVSLLAVLNSLRALK